MPASTGPDLKKYMDKKLQSEHSCHMHALYLRMYIYLPVSMRPQPHPPSPQPPSVKLNGNRHITGTLRGFDQFMNLVIDEAVEQASPQPHLAPHTPHPHISTSMPRIHARTHARTNARRVHSVIVRRMARAPPWCHPGASVLAPLAMVSVW